MSHKAPEFLVGVKAGVDFTGKLHKAYKLDASGNCIVGTLGDALGTVYNEATLNGSIEATTIGGGSDAIAAAILAPGDEITSDANGDAIKALVGNMVFGIMTEAAAVGQHCAYLNVIYRKV